MYVVETGALVPAQSPTVSGGHGGGIAKGIVAASNNPQLDVVAQSSTLVRDCLFCPLRGRM